MPDCKKISVVVPSYNHQEYIVSALNSVLNQTYQDYEIIILDDASSDGSLETIKGFLVEHPGLECRFVQHAQNQGGVITLNDLIGLARGEYIALINSDDLWKPEKLTIQVDFLDAHPEVGAVFTQAEIIDDFGNLMTDTVHFPTDIFMQKNRSRGKWLRRLFFELNCLCHPSILIRRLVYQEIGLYDPRYRQLPDMQMWVRLLKHTDIHMIEQPLVQLRFHRSNTSKVNSQNSHRNIHEFNFMMPEFFDGMPDEIFIEGFQDLFQNKDAFPPHELACEKAFMYFRRECPVKSVYYNAGLRKMYELLGAALTRKALLEKYQFDFNKFFELDGKFPMDDFLRMAVRLEMEENNHPQAAALPWYLAVKVRISRYMMKYPFIYRPALKVWRWLRGYKA